MPRKTTRTAAAETAAPQSPRIEDIRTSLARLADEAENRKIDLESDFPDASPAQLESIDRAQTCTAQAMELLVDARDLLDPSAPRFDDGGRGAERPSRVATAGSASPRVARLLDSAANALAALLDAVQGMACEQGPEALERYCKDPVGLMEKTTAILGSIKDFTAGKKEEK